MLDTKRQKLHSPEPESAGKLVIQNVVVIADFGRPLEISQLQEYYLKNRSATIDFDRQFQGIRIKQNENISGYVFRSGKVLCTGARSEAEAKSVGTTMLMVLKKMVYHDKSQGAVGRFEVPRVNNIVATFNTGYDIQLEHLALEHEKDVTYEPEVYPSLIYSFSDNPQKKIVAFISAKGKVVISGAKFEDDIHKAHQALAAILSKFRRDGPNYHMTTS